MRPLPSFWNLSAKNCSSSFRLRPSMKSTSHNRKVFTDQPWGHRTLFFRDPDGSILEVYAEIWLGEV